MGIQNLCRKYKSFIFLIICFLLQPTKFLHSAPLERAIEREGVCAMARSSMVPEDIFDMAKEYLRRRFHGECQILSSSLDDPFSERAKILWQDAAIKSPVGFWLDVQGGGKYLFIQAFDLDSLLPWSQIDTPMAGLAADAIQHIVRSVLDQLITAYEFVGVLEADGIVAWSSRKNPVEVHLVRVQGPLTHPFIPGRIGFAKKTTIKDSEATLFLDSDGHWKLRWKKNAPAKSNGRLWLVENEHRQ